jgi:hydrogenase nickel incorporation protein HypA/HybF
MHELAICQELLEQVEEIARARQAVACAITVRVGPLSGVEPALLQRAYLVARAGTRSDNAQLLIEECCVRIRCRSCGTEAEVQSNRLACVSCGEWRTELLSGDELLLASVELNRAA